MIIPELKLCPFCGNKANIYIAGGGIHKIRCENDKNCKVMTDFFNTEKEAIEAWNRRTIENND